MTGLTRRAVAMLALTLTLTAPVSAWAFNPMVHVRPELLSELLSPLKDPIGSALELWRAWENTPEAQGEAVAQEDPFGWELPKRRDWMLIDGDPIVGTPRVHELWHTVGKYQNAFWITKRYQMRRANLEALNPGVDLDGLEVGDQLLVWRRDPSALSESVGKPSSGRLKNGEPLPTGEKYQALWAHRTFGTYYAVSEIVRVMDAYAQRFPWAERLIVGDLSVRRGRKLSPHVSHRSGRDLDISYPRRTDPPNYRRFHPIPRRDLDPERTLWLLRAFLDRGHVEYVFIDRPIQRMLYYEAKRQGAPAEWLAAVFQYPRRVGTRAIVRTSKGHDDHMHIRWHCQPTDTRCF